MSEDININSFSLIYVNLERRNGKFCAITLVVSLRKADKADVLAIAEGRKHRRSGPIFIASDDTKIYLWEYSRKLYTR
jgi:hypothetical protein